MMRNGLLRALTIGIALGLAACATPDATEDRAVDPEVVSLDTGQIAGAPSPLGDDIRVYRGIRKDRLDFLDQYYAAMRVEAN